MINTRLNRLPRKEDAPEMASNDTMNVPTTNPRSLLTSVGDDILGGRIERPGNRYERPEPSLTSGHEEVLIVDDRAALRPAQVVESKLTRLLQESSLPVSHLQMRGLLRTR